MTPTQKGDLRDKVAVLDPAAAPDGSDSEAAGTPTGRAASEADRTQAGIAQAAVPRVDASRAVSTAEHPEQRRLGILAPLAAAGAATLVVVGLALWLTLPGV
jgi:hypothetical protein